MLLSGNFGELRPNHFHSGFDLRTLQREGLAVHSVADGYVSRIKISPFGNGKAIYITHPNGYTSVYCHLQKGLML
jgi:murein DD-endopeptidase MepM/ murein hydrolase activator NlpD